MPFKDPAKRAEWMRQYREANKERLAEMDRVRRQANKEQIYEATKRRRAANPEQKRRSDRAYRERHPDRGKAYREANRGRYQEHSKQWYHANRERAIATSRAWREQNIDRVRAKAAAWMRAQKQSNPEHRIRVTLRRRMLGGIKRGAKAGPSIDLLGCSWAEARAHLERLWLPGMSWTNHGINGWHIDHIRPIASFDLTDPDQQRAAFHYTNLQPLWARDNWSKGQRAA